MQLEIITSEVKGTTTIYCVTMKLYFLCEAHRCVSDLGFWNPLKSGNIGKISGVQGHFFGRGYSGSFGFRLFMAVRNCEFLENRGIF